VPSDREIFGTSEPQSLHAWVVLRGTLWTTVQPSFFLCLHTIVSMFPGSIKDTLLSHLSGTPIRDKFARLFVLLGFGRGTHVLDLKILENECA